MKELLPFILFLVIIGGVNALRWLIEKQQREKEESARRGAEPPAHAATPGRRPIFYGRPGERRPTPVPPSEAEAPLPSPLRPMQPPIRRLQPLAASAEAAARPSTVRKQQRTRRTAAARAPQPAQTQPLRAEPPRESSLQKAPAAASAIPKAAAGEPHLTTPFFGDLLAPKNLARAVVLAEILGPPKALQDL